MQTATGERRDPRPRFRALASVVALAVLLVAGAAASPTAPSADAKPRAHMFSVVPSTWLSWDEYQRLGAGGVNAIRVAFHWHVIEHGQDEFNWGTTDTVAIYAAANGIRLQPFLLDVPKWLQSENAYPAVRSSDFRREWRQYLRALIDRYGPGGYLWRWLRQEAPWVKPKPVKAWQIWNEPNAHSYWHPVGRSPEMYARLLRYSSQIIRARQPRAQVVTAGLFETPPDGISMQRFLRRFYEVAGIRRFFDVLAIHPYARNRANVLRQLRWVRGLMDENGDARTPIRVTEVGWPTKVTSGNGVFTKSEAGQRRQLVSTFKAFNRRRKALGLESVAWYTWRDSTQYASCDLCRYSGLFREDGSAKPAWRAFVRFTGGSRRAPRAAGAHSPPPVPPQGAGQ